MKVNIYLVHADDTETVQSIGADLADCFPETLAQGCEVYEAEERIKAYGEILVGGGAQPLLRIRESDD